MTTGLMASLMRDERIFLMNDVYGIDPSAPSSIEEFTQLLRLFGVGEGRFIGKFPFDWISRFHEHVQSLSPIEQHRLIQRWVDLGKNSLVPVQAIGTYKENFGWLENSALIKDDVVKIIGSKKCSAIATPLNEALMSPDGFPDASGAHIERTPKAYAKAARPLMQISPKVVLVDPYFKFRYRDIHDVNKIKFSKRHADSLSALVTEALRWKRVEIFHLVISEKEALIDDPDASTFVSDLTEISNRCGAPDNFFTYDLLDPNYSTDRHPRYLLGMHQGLKFDWGFDVDDQKSRSPTSTNHVEWMGEKVLEPLLKRFT